MNAQPNKKVIWKLVQHENSSHGCIDTTYAMTWHKGENMIDGMNFTLGKKEEILEEQDNEIIAYDIMLNNKRRISYKITILNKNIIAYYTASNVKSRGKIVRRTKKLLFISWEPGSIDIYQNINTTKDSISTKQIGDCIIESGKMFGKKITYCQ